MVLAVTEPTPDTQSSTDAFSYTTASFTPTANSLLVVWVAASDTLAAGTCTHPAVASFTRVGSRSLGGTGNGTLYCFIGQVGASPSAGVVTFGCSGDQATGAEIAVQEVTGHKVSAPTCQFVSVAQSSTSAPSVTRAAPQADTCHLGAVMAQSAQSATTPSGWVQTAANFHLTPSSGLWAGYRTSAGESGTSFGVTLGGTASTAIAYLEIYPAGGERVSVGNIIGF